MVQRVFLEEGASQDKEDGPRRRETQCGQRAQPGAAMVCSLEDQEERTSGKSWDKDGIEKVRPDTGDMRTKQRNLDQTQVKQNREPQQALEQES